MGLLHGASRVGLLEKQLRSVWGAILDECSGVFGVFEGLLGKGWFCVATEKAVPAGLEKVESTVLGLAIFSY